MVYVQNSAIFYLKGYNIDCGHRSLTTEANILDTQQLTSGSFKIVEFLMNFQVFVVFLLRLLSYTFFIDLINDKKSRVNFGLYSCDWTAADIPFKKNVLMAMQINNANELKIKVTPTIAINMGFTLRVLRMTYSIVSVMLNTGFLNSYWT
ncbi:uncharacterized protein LOC126838719 isoform X1 [Adelges cooleyi]|uniref:uncharacterized protein LOC126838719 isoform X1 n=1 Tax=Adelges cooleyi TaxID=133065 RepID=UPI00217FC230|nr:uncharacterized protein LOC126838719 isoform X1 [Adelges cooleyi]